MLIEQGAKIFGLEEKFHFFFLMYILYHFLNFLSSVLTLNLPIWGSSADMTITTVSAFILVSDIRTVRC